LRVVSGDLTDDTGKTRPLLQQIKIHPYSKALSVENRPKICSPAPAYMSEKFSSGTKNNNIQLISIRLIIQKAITKSSVGHHGPPTNAKVGSGVMEE
jgi:hypothetical protein